MYFKVSQRDGSGSFVKFSNTRADGGIGNERKKSGTRRNTGIGAVEQEYMSDKE